jgi:tetratricopeptide (TPR) repeat protein
MKKIINTIIIFTLFVCKAYGQSSELQKYVSAGVKLFDKGEYKKALAIDKKSPLANYEISSTYLVLKEYDMAIEHCDKVIEAKSDYVDQAYILKGSALDVLGKSNEAIKTYKQAIKNYPKNHLLYYNLALTSYNIKEYKEAEEALQKGLQVNPSHANSHLLLCYVMKDQNDRVKSVLPLYNFLLLEPKGKRAESALALLHRQLKKGVKKESDKKTIINLNLGDKNNEFTSAEFMLSILEASKNTDENAKKTENELFSETTKSFFTVLGEMKKNKTGFWWDYYVNYFYSLSSNNHIDALCYHISQSSEDENINKWLKDNNKKILSFLKWQSSYER